MANVGPASDLSEWITSEPGRIIAEHPSLVPFAHWLCHLWEHGELEPTGPVPSYRRGIDESSGVVVEYSTAPLPIVASAPSLDAPVSVPAQAASQTPTPARHATLLLEYLSVVQLHFFIPPNLRYLFSHLLLISGLFLAVQIPSISWSEGRFGKIHVFEALCREISSACLGVEARCDWLIFREINGLRSRFFLDLRHRMENVSHRVADIPYHTYTQNDAHAPRAHHSRRLYAYEPLEYEHAFSGGALILRQQDPGEGDGCELGLMIWAGGEPSQRPSHTTLFHLTGNPPPGTVHSPVSPGIRRAPWFTKAVEARMMCDAVTSAQSSLFERYGW